MSGFQSRAVEVYDIPDSYTALRLRLLFESQETSGGGEIKALLYKPNADAATIIFHSSDVSQRLIDKKNISFKGHTLIVRPHVEDIIVTNIPQGQTQLKVILYFESASSGGGPLREDRCRFDADCGMAILCYENPIDAENVVRKTKHVLKGNSLGVTPLFQSPLVQGLLQTTFTVSNCTDITNIRVELYVDHQTDNGVLHLTKSPYDPDICYITLRSVEAARVFRSKMEYEIKGQRNSFLLHVSPFSSENGIGEILAAREHLEFALFKIDPKDREAIEKFSTTAADARLGENLKTNPPTPPTPPSTPTPSTSHIPPPAPGDEPDNLKSNPPAPPPTPPPAPPLALSPKPDGVRDSITPSPPPPVPALPTSPDSSPPAHASVASPAQLQERHVNSPVAPSMRPIPASRKGSSEVSNHRHLKEERERPPQSSPNLLEEIRIEAEKRRARARAGEVIPMVSQSNHRLMPAAHSDDLTQTLSRTLNSKFSNTRESIDDITDGSEISNTRESSGENEDNDWND